LAKTFPAAFAKGDETQNVNKVVGAKKMGVTTSAGCCQLSRAIPLAFVLIVATFEAKAEANVLFGQASTMSLTTAQSGERNYYTSKLVN
jgi:hypothetical protein